MPAHVNYNCVFILESIAAEDTFGFLNVQVEVFKHPGTGEYKVNVKGECWGKKSKAKKRIRSQSFTPPFSVLSASDLGVGGSGGGVTISGVFRPFVEVYLFGPLLSDRKRRFATKSKSGTISPMFNETFVL